MIVKIITIGKIKEKYLQMGIDEYLKRIKPYCNIQIKELKESITNDIVKNLSEEAKTVLSFINKDDYVITLEIEGKNINSFELSQLIYNHYLYSDKTIVFVIGGSDGLDDSIKARSNFALSFSSFTFPHQLMRLILLEQIYRAIMIKNNNKYHK